MTVHMSAEEFLQMTEEERSEVLGEMTKNEARFLQVRLKTLESRRSCSAYRKAYETAKREAKKFGSHG